jgi:hypothetical protein
MNNTFIIFENISRNILHKFDSYNELSEFIRNSDNLKGSQIKIKCNKSLLDTYVFDKIITSDNIGQKIITYKNLKSNRDNGLKFVIKDTKKDNIRDKYNRIINNNKIYDKEYINEQYLIKITQELENLKNVAKYNLINGDDIMILKNDDELKEYLSNNKGKYNYKKLKIIDNIRGEIFKFDDEKETFVSNNSTLPNDIVDCMKSSFKMLYVYAPVEDKPLDLKYDTFFEKKLFTEVDSEGEGRKQANNYRRFILDEDHEVLKTCLIAGIYVVKDNFIVMNIDKSGTVTVNGNYHHIISSGTHSELLRQMKQFDETLNEIEDFFPYFEEFGQGFILANGIEQPNSCMNIYGFYFDMKLSNKEMIEIVKKHIELDAIISLKN